MTPAEFKTIRESLGLSAQWLADRVGVKLRTIQYWEAGNEDVKPDVAAFLLDIDRRIDHAVSQSLLLVEEHGSDHVELVRYRTEVELWSRHPEMEGLPTATHAAMLARLRRALEARGVCVTLTFQTIEDRAA